MALVDYLATEVAEDWTDGLIARREALRRLVRLGLSSSAGAAILAACATPAVPAATSAVPATVSALSPWATAATEATTPSPPTASAGPVAGQAVTFAGPRDALRAYLALTLRPAGAMVVIHENPGLTDHIRSVAGRLADDANVVAWFHAELAR